MVRPLLMVEDLTSRKGHVPNPSFHGDFFEFQLSQGIGGLLQTIASSIDHPRSSQLTHRENS